MTRTSIDMESLREILERGDRDQAIKHTGKFLDCSRGQPPGEGQ
jgi:hypothetical protein